MTPVFGSRIPIDVIGGVLAVVLGVLLGAQIGAGYTIVGIIVALAGVAALAAATLFRGQPVEAVVLGLLLIGYFVGNRGFAQIAIVPPLFVGECGMAVILAAFVARYAMTRRGLELRTLLSGSIALYFLYGLIHFWIDRKVYGWQSARDFAIVYYCLFFFFGHQLGQRKETVRFLLSCLIVAIVGQLIMALVLQFDQELMYNIRIGGVPFLMQKGDLTGTFSVAGIVMLIFVPDLIRTAWFRHSLIILQLLTLIFSMARAAYMSFIVVLAVGIYSRRRLMVHYPAFTAIIILLVIAVSEMGIRNGGFKAYVDNSIEKVSSMFDVTGRHRYTSDIGELKATNNEFRRIFWQVVVDKTSSSNWLTGMGFGYDFLPEFEQTYGRGTFENTRSPHNYYVTVYGRLGVVGLCFFAVITFAVLRLIFLSAVSSRRHAHNPTTGLAFLTAALVLLVSGTFGVVLEGPMGAIPFWSFLGIGHGLLRATASKHTAPVEQQLPDISSIDLHPTR